MKKKRIVVILTMLLLITLSFIPKVQAKVNVNEYKPGELVAVDYYAPMKLAGTILNAIVITGVSISVISVMGLGIKYMMGSVEERAEYKKTMIPMLVGMIMLFCTSTIVSIIYNIVFNASK